MKGKTSVISVRVSMAERARIEADAATKGVAVSAHARSLLVGFDSDTMRVKAREAVEQQEQTLARLLKTTADLDKNITQVNKRIRADKTIVVAVLGLLGVILLVAGIGTGYAVALLSG